MSLTTGNYALKKTNKSVLNFIEKSLVKGVGEMKSRWTREAETKKIEKKRHYLLPEEKQAKIERHKTKLKKGTGLQARTLLPSSRSAMSRMRTHQGIGVGGAEFLKGTVILVRNAVGVGKISP